MAIIASTIDAALSGAECRTRMTELRQNMKQCEKLRDEFNNDAENIVEAVLRKVDCALNDKTGNDMRCVVEAIRVLRDACAFSPGVRRQLLLQGLFMEGNTPVLSVQRGIGLLLTMCKDSLQREGQQAVVCALVQLLSNSVSGASDLNDRVTLQSVWGALWQGEGGGQSSLLCRLLRDGDASTICAVANTLFCLLLACDTLSPQQTVKVTPIVRIAVRNLSIGQDDDNTVNSSAQEREQVFDFNYRLLRRLLRLGSSEALIHDLNSFRSWMPLLLDDVEEWEARTRSHSILLDGCPQSPLASTMFENFSVEDWALLSVRLIGDLSRIMREKSASLEKLAHVTTGLHFLAIASTYFTQQLVERILAQTGITDIIKTPFDRLIAVGMQCKGRRAFEGEPNSLESLLGQTHLCIVRFLGNISYGCGAAQDAVRESGLIPLLLNSAKVFPDSPFIKEWAILALRNVCEGNIQNQQLISGISAVGAVETPNELSQMGLRMEMSGGRPVLRRAEENSS